MRKLWIAAVAAMVMMPTLASARVFVGIGPGFGYYGYGYGYPYGYGFGYPIGYGFGPSMGSVKIDTPAKTAAVYINEAYAGTVAQVKTMHLRPGTYTIRVDQPGLAPFVEKVYVAAGHTTHIQPSLTAPPIPGQGQAPYPAQAPYGAAPAQAPYGAAPPQGAYGPAPGQPPYGNTPQPAPPLHPF